MESLYLQNVWPKNSKKGGKRFIYFLDWISERERKKESTHWFPPQIRTMALGISSAKGTSKGLRLGPFLGVGAQTLVTSLTALPRPSAWSWIGNGVTGTQTDAHIGCWLCKWQLYAQCHNADPLHKYLLI